MPTYEFKCHRCGAREEFLVSMNVIDLKTYFCERCGTEMTRVFSPVGAVFKGSGFYQTDNRPKPPEPKPEKKEKKSETSKAPSDIS